MLTQMRRIKSACRDCKKCMGSGVAVAGRNSAKAGMAVMTLGLSSLALSFKRKCRVCDHQLSLHADGGLQPR